jgi:hypothetical protein
VALKDGRVVATAAEFPAAELDSSHDSSSLLPALRTAVAQLTPNTTSRTDEILKVDYRIRRISVKWLIRVMPFILIEPVARPPLKIKVEYVSIPCPFGGGHLLSGLSVG